MVMRSAGVTLIELAVTLAIMAMLMAATIPFTSAWVQKARVSEAKTKLQQGYVLSKALAQRNSVGAIAPAYAAGINLVGDTLLVCTGNPAAATCAIGAGGVTWQVTLPANTTVNFGGGQTLGFDNTGLPLGTIHFSITNGGQSDADNFG